MGEMPCVTSEGLNGISVQSAGKVQRVLGKSRLRSPSNSFEVSSEVGYTRGWVISPFLEEVTKRYLLVPNAAGHTASRRMTIHAPNSP